MKVYIGPYRNWIGPYQIADALLFWSKNEDLKDDFGRWLSTNKNGDDSLLSRICNWVHRKRPRKIKVRIDNYDTWNADHTLALIIVPLLKKMKKHGTPWTDREDAPADPIYDDKDTDDEPSGYSSERWEYILREMIYAFEMKLDEDWDLRIYENGGWSENNLAKRQAIHDRMQNGFRLFGKYYNNLWT